MNSNSESKLKHIAFIMDGNRRYARKNGLSLKDGYLKGLKTMFNIIRFQVDLNIYETTFWALSTENWKNRDKNELDNSLKDAISKLFNKEDEEYFSENNIDINLIGDVDEILQSDEIRSSFENELKDLMCRLENYKKKISKKEIKHKVNICINYGGHQELIIAFKKIASKILNGEIMIEEINEDLIKKNLFFNQSPPPEVIVRTGDAPRLSGFMSWDSAYSEIYLTKKLWPELEKEDILEVLVWFTKINRNFGK